MAKAKRQTKVQREAAEKIRHIQIRTCRIVEARLMEHGAGLRATVYALDRGLTLEMRQEILAIDDRLQALAHRARTEALSLTAESLTAEKERKLAATTGIKTKKGAR